MGISCDPIAGRRDGVERGGRFQSAGSSLLDASGRIQHLLSVATAMHFVKR
jgi:hypothetical protein